MHRFAVFVASLAFGCSSGSAPADAGDDSGGEPDGSSLDAKSDAPDASGGDAGCAPITAAATISGTFFGATMTFGDAVAVQGDPQKSLWGVGVSDHAGLCTELNHKVSKPGSKLIGFGYQGPTPPSPGAVDLATANGLWDIQYQAFGATCSVQNEQPSSGTFTVSRVDACGVVISAFDLMFENSGGFDHVTGSISAPNCVYAPVATDAGCP